MSDIKCYSLYAADVNLVNARAHLTKPHALFFIPTAAD